MGTSSDIKAIKAIIDALTARVAKLENVVIVPSPPPVPGTAGSVVVILTRHGEKDDNKDGVDDNPHALSVRGRQRALAIRDKGLFTGSRSDLYKPNWIFASGPPPTRMVETIKPTADALGLTLDSSLNSEVAISQTAALLAKQALTGKIVLGVLEHSALPGVGAALVKALGGTWTGKVPTSWDDADFHTGWKFVGDGAGHWTFSTFEESVLVGDPGYQAP